MAFVRLFRSCWDPRSASGSCRSSRTKARTFGMDAMFPVQKIYNPPGRCTGSVDRELFLSYKAVDGQILHEGISKRPARRRHSRQPVRPTPPTTNR